MGKAHHRTGFARAHAYPELIWDARRGVWKDAKDISGYVSEWVSGTAKNAKGVPRDVSGWASQWFSETIWDRK